MWDWFLASFKEDPAGWIAIGLFIIGASIFWRRVWQLIRWVSRRIGRFFIWLFSVRITTKKHLKPKRTKQLPKARWIVAEQAKGGRIEFILANVAEDSVATNVVLEVPMNGVRLLSAAVWDSIPGMDVGKFKMHIENGDAPFGLKFRVEWDDARGERQVEEWGGAVVKRER